MLYTDNTIRQCSRCGLELTDAASRECGVGPICRKKDNHLYAKAIPANFAGATMCVMSIKVETLPSECHTHFAAMKHALLKRAERATRANDDPLCLHLTGEDCRTIVREIDLILSFRVGDFNKDLLVKTVRYLGYVGLAGVLSGKASTSDAELAFVGGRVSLRGLGCTDGYRAMRRIPGIEVPRYRGDRRPYTAPAAEAAKFIEVVREFWPCFKGDAAEIQRQADAWVSVTATPPAVTQPSPVPALPVATIRHNPGQVDFSLTFPWVAGQMSAVLTGLKSVPPRERKYNPTTKTWTFQARHLAKVVQVLSPVYTVSQTR